MIFFFSSPCKISMCYKSVTNQVKVSCQKTLASLKVLSAFQHSKKYLQLFLPVQCNCEDRIFMLFVQLVSQVVRGRTRLNSLGTVTHQSPITCHWAECRVQGWTCWTCRTLTLCDVCCAFQSEGLRTRMILYYIISFLPICPQPDISGRAVVGILMSQMRNVSLKWKLCPVQKS